MKRPFEAWRRSLALWGLPLVFCLLNLLVLGFYFAFYAGEVARLEKRNEIAEGDLAQLSRQSEEIEIFLGRIASQRQNIRTLHREHFQTEAERFTRAIQEVKELARDAGLQPTSFSYPQQVLDQEGLIQREIQFSVEGTYRQMRTFINFLELTDQFLTLNSVALTTGGPERLNIRLQLSTVFAADTSNRETSDRDTLDHSAPARGSDLEDSAPPPDPSAPGPKGSEPSDPTLQGSDPDAPTPQGSATGETT